MAALSDYRIEVLRYLRDASLSYFSQAEIDFFINKAMQQRDWDTAMNRTLVQFSLTSGTANYNISTVATTGTVLFGSSTNVFDVFNIVLRYANTRVILDQQPWAILTAFYQNIQGYQQVPSGYSKFGALNVVLAPSPNQAFVTEWDLGCYSPLLVAPGDTDPLPYPWTDPVPFLAAAFASRELQRQEDFEKYMQLYDERINKIMAQARSMMIPSAYSSIPPGWGNR